METYGAVDVLVSNAAVNPAAGLILDMPDSAIEKILDVNVKSAILLTKEARPHMSKVSLKSHPSQPSATFPISLCEWAAVTKLNTVLSPNNVSTCGLPGAELHKG
jgi:dehydrogenase/reductase SDR family protein 4